jgi:hypothetical protein
MHVWMKVKCSEEIYYGWVYVWGTLHYPSLDWGWECNGYEGVDMVNVSVDVISKARDTVG